MYRWKTCECRYPKAFSHDPRTENMRLVLPGQEALEVLERAGTTKDECTERLRQMLTEEHVQLCVFRTRVFPGWITLRDDPRQQGAYSFTYYITVIDHNGPEQFVAQFREDGIERTSMDLLDSAESVFGAYVAKPLFISPGNPLQVTFWEYYGENLQQKFFYDKFTVPQKQNAMREYAAFLALGCREALPETRSNSTVLEQFENIATWTFPPSIAQIIVTMKASIGLPFIRIQD
jgi:hypothetical protein